MLSNTNRNMLICWRLYIYLQRMS